MQRINPISQVAVSQRTRQLRRQRWWRGISSTWRSLLILILAGGLLWLFIQPDWVIYRPEQVIIQGNQFFSAAAIRSLLPLTYPQSLMKLQPEAIAAYLEAQGPIAKAVVSRNLLPPSLTIHIKERRPVAISIPNPVGAASPLENRRPPNPAPSSLVPQPQQSAATTEGLIDETGVWMPRTSYAALGLPLPNLKVIGLSEDLRPLWAEIYQVINLTKAQITEIDCRNPSNLILTTSLGKVHLGRYSPNFAKQLGILETLYRVPQQLNPSQIAYINLRDIDRPQIVDKKPDPKPENKPDSK
jgi:cell division protein FtsQ